MQGSADADDRLASLAEAEVEYEDHTSPSIYVKFPLLSPPSVLGGAAIFGLTFPKEVTKVSVVIWTTTPWTLISNVAVAVNPELDYTEQTSWLLFLKYLDGLEEEDVVDAVVAQERMREADLARIDAPFGRVLAEDPARNTDGIGRVGDRADRYRAAARAWRG